MQSRIKNLQFKKSSSSRLPILAEIIQKISSFPGWRERFLHIYNQLSGLLGIEQFRIGLCDDKTDCIEWIFQVDGSEINTNIVSGKIEPSEQKVIKKGKTIILKNKPTAGSGKFLSPISYNNLVVGMLSLQIKSMEDYIQEDVELISAVASVLGLLIQNLVITETRELKNRNNSSFELTEADKLNRKLKSIIDVARAIAHELNQPLTGISGYCTLIMEELKDNGNAQILEDLNEIQKQANRLEGLIMKFQSVAQIENNETNN